MAGSRNEAGDDYRADRDAQEPASLDVIGAVADYLRTDAVDLQPLADTVDPEAVDSLFAGASSDSGVRLSFRYEGVEVTVTAESIELRPSD